MATYDIYNNGNQFTMLTTQNYVKNIDGTISTIADLSTLSSTEVGFIGNPSAVHKNLLTDRNISVLDEKKSDKTHNHDGVYEPIDLTILRNNDIGITVEGFDASILKSADIGITIQPFDNTVLNVADIGVAVEPFDTTILKSVDIGITVGDMIKSIYDPTNINSSPYDRTNHIGTQTLSTISDAGNSAALNTGTTAGTVALGDHTHPAPASVPSWNIVTAAQTLLTSNKYLTVIAAPITLILPIAPIAGDSIKIADGDNNWGINTVTLDNNTNTIEGVLGTFVLNINGGNKEIVYTGATWRVL